MIELSNGHRFEFCAASGALGFDGQGWRLTDFPGKYLFSALQYSVSHPSFLVLPLLLEIRKKELADFVRVTKTITYNPIEGRPDAICEQKNSVINAVSLFNPGVQEWKRKYLPQIISNPDLKIILSITAENLIQLNDLLTEIIEIKNKNIIGLEFNPSCPNVPNMEKIWSPRKIKRACGFIKEKTTLPLGLKIAYHQDYLSIARLTEKMVEWLSFNAIPWEKVFPDKESPLKKKFETSGAVSGKKIQKLNQKMALRIRSSGIKTPILASGVGWAENFEEAYQEFLKVVKKTEEWEWADGIAFGSIFRKHPLWPIRMILRHQKEEIPVTVRAWWFRK